MELLSNDPLRYRPIPITNYFSTANSPKNRRSTTGLLSFEFLQNLDFPVREKRFPARGAVMLVFNDVDINFQHGHLMTFAIVIVTKNIVPGCCGKKVPAFAHAGNFSSRIRSVNNSFRTGCLGNKCEMSMTSIKCYYPAQYSCHYYHWRVHTFFNEKVVVDKFSRVSCLLRTRIITVLACGSCRRA
jgi:hypothetical protein